ncbi:MAG: hypothetical protein KTR31_37780 [Myxococcales bacterium]|nr:hypothetical protein [Myxococcales bacterium]
MKYLNIYLAIFMIPLGGCPYVAPVVEPDIYTLECDSAFTCLGTLEVSLADVVGCYADELTGEIDCDAVPEALKGDCCDDAQDLSDGVAGAPSSCTLTVGPDAVDNHNVCCIYRFGGEVPSTEELDECCGEDATERESPLESDMKVLGNEVQDDCLIDFDATTECTQVSVGLGTVSGPVEECDPVSDAVTIDASVASAESTYSITLGGTVVATDNVHGLFVGTDDPTKQSFFVLDTDDVGFGGFTYSEIGGYGLGQVTVSTASTTTFVFDPTQTGGIIRLNLEKNGTDRGYQPLPTNTLQGTLDATAGTWSLDYQQLVGPYVFELHLEGTATFTSL